MNRLSVSQLNLLISRELSLSPRLSHVEVEAEVGRLTKHGSGHYYFTIKDHFSSIDCVMFRGNVEKNPYDFQEGDRVLLHGRISLYDKTARLQFYVQRVEPLGEGALLRAFYALKDQFEEEGLLDPLRKRSLPRLPRSIALLTSATGAAREDFMKVLLERNPFCEIKLYPVAVQGEAAVDSILAALDQVEEEDVLVLTRGGGSYEDLAIFNDEMLCRKLAASQVPTLCAIGHEIDFTLAELVADRRGATPTEAAQLVSEDVQTSLRSLMHRIDLHGKRRQLELEKEALLLGRSLQFMKNRLEQALLDTGRELFDYKDKLHLLLEDRIRNEKEQMEQLMRRIHGYNPKEILARGYVAVEQKGWIRKKEDVQPGGLKLHFVDGVLEVETKDEL